MKVLVTGGRGQLGRGIVRRAAAAGVSVVALGRQELDVTDGVAVAAALRAYEPGAVIHAASFTQVDRAESEREAAEAVNVGGTERVARACAELRVPVIYVSTDYVFDGRSDRPYREGDATGPLNVYGATKLRGEHAVREVGGTIVRTAWLFGDGGPSFVHAIAGRAKENSALRVVRDQVGNPTWADDLADALLQLAKEGSRGEVVHVCGDEPVSRHAFAVAICDALATITPVACTRVDAVTSDELDAAAVRPAYAPLDTTKARARGLPIRSWRDGLRVMLRREFSP